jgi:molecular chaperone HscB
MTVDHFERLGLPRRFAVDAAALEREYLARSRAVHPDFHSAGSSSDLAASMDSAAALNEAYNTVRQPFARAEHLLALEGGPSASEHKAMPPAFLAEMLEAREAVENARGSDADVERLDREFRERRDQLFADVTRQFELLTQVPQGDPRRTKILHELHGLLNAIKFVQGLLRDLHDE